MRGVNRWKVFDNLRRSLVAPAALALMALVLVRPVVSPWAALALVFAAFGAGPLLGVIAGFAPSRDSIAVRHFYRGAALLKWAVERRQPNRLKLRPDGVVGPHTLAK